MGFVHFAGLGMIMDAMHQPQAELHPDALFRHDVCGSDTGDWSCVVNGTTEVTEITEHCSKGQAKLPVLRNGTGPENCVPGSGCSLGGRPKVLENPAQWPVCSSRGLAPRVHSHTAPSTVATRSQPDRSPTAADREIVSEFEKRRSRRSCGPFEL